MKKLMFLFLIVIILISCSKSQIKPNAVTPQDILVKQTDINAQSEDIIKMEQKQIDPSNPFEIVESTFIKKYGIENSSYKGASIEYRFKDRKIYAEVYAMKNVEDAEKRISFTLELLKEFNVNTAQNDVKIGDKSYALESSGGLAGHSQGILFRKGNIVASVSVSRVEDKNGQNDKEEAVILTKVMEKRIG